MATINNITEVTNGSIVSNEWVGTGMFDVLMNAVNKNIETQFNKGRITGAQYAEVYLGGLQAVLQQSIAYALDADVKAAQVDSVTTDTAVKLRDMTEKELSGAKQREVLESQKALYTRQKESFDDNKFQKVLETQIAYHQMTYADNPTPIVPDMILNNAVMDVFNKILTNQPVNVYAES
jgi:hypothetical protein